MSTCTGIILHVQWIHICLVNQLPRTGSNSWLIPALTKMKISKVKQQLFYVPIHTIHLLLFCRFLSQCIPDTIQLTNDNRLHKRHKPIVWDKPWDKAAINYNATSLRTISFKTTIPVCSPIRLLLHNTPTIVDSDAS